MIITFIKIQEISTPNLSYYTVQLQSEALSEFELFDANDFSSHQNEISQIYAVIEEMGLTEAKPYYFVEEGGFEYLPRMSVESINSNGRNDFGIRLYCKFLNPNIVLLFNGGIKTQLNPTNCPNVSVHFKRAKAISNYINKWISLDVLKINYTELEIDQDFDFEI